MLVSAVTKEPALGFPSLAPSAATSLPHPILWQTLTASSEAGSNVTFSWERSRCFCLLFTQKGMPLSILHARFLKTL